MLNSFALSAVSGLRVLFGLNSGHPFSRTVLVKTGRPGKYALPLNGQLILHSGVDVLSRPGLSPLPDHALYGVEISGGHETARQQANQAARAAIASLSPDPAVLRAYSGGGGIGESVDQFYTPAILGQLLWDAVTPHLKLEDEKKAVRVLEPSCGNGSLLAHAPEGVLLTGVEMDAVAARAAQLLHPHASIHAMPFERYTTRSSDALFDLVIGNPPYGPRGETRDLHERNEVRSERYFMRQIIRRCQFQSGLISVLLPISLLHGSSHQAWREEVLRAALPLHAAVVPSGAFKESGAGVTTALLILRRHDHGGYEALSTLSSALVTSVLKEFAADLWQRQLIEHFASGRSLIETTGREGEFTHKLRWNMRAFCLGEQTTLRCGQYGNPLLEGPLREENFEAVHTQMACAVKSQPVVFKALIETIRDVSDDAAAQGAEHAALGASLHAIAEGTPSADRRHVFTLGQWAVTDDFAAPPVAAAVQVAQALQGYLEAAALGRPEAVKLRTQALKLDAQCREAHGGYDRMRFSRLIPRYSLFAVLLAHLDEAGALLLKEERAARLPITATDITGVAGQLADLLSLTEETLAGYAQCSLEEAARHLQANYAFNGELWVEPGLYYTGHAYERAELARSLAQQFTGHRRAALLRQADLLVSKINRASLNDLDLSPRDAVIPAAVLEVWVNDLLGSRDQDRALISVRRENGAVRFRMRGGAGESGLRARSNVDTRKVKALEAYLNHKTEVSQVKDARDMSKERYKAERAVAVSEAQAYEEQTHGHFRGWLMRSDFISVVEEAYTVARGAVLVPQGSSRPLNLPDWRGKTPHPYQAMDVRAMAAVSGMINNYDVGVGKALDDSMPVATPHGWTPMGELKVGDQVIGSAGKPVKVIGVFPQGLRLAFNVTFTDGSDVICDEEHLWTVWCPNRRARKQLPRTLTLKQIMAEGLLDRKNTDHNAKRHFIPMVGPVEYAGQGERPLDPYLLGTLLGDGSFRGGIPTFSTADDEMLASVRAALPEGMYLDSKGRVDYRITPRGNMGRPRQPRNVVRLAIQELGLWGLKSEGKFIPECYKFAPVDVRLAVLQGLLDTDSHVRPDNNIEYCTVSKQLAEDVQFLVQSLGGVAPIRLKPTSGQLAYRMSVALPADVKPFRLSRKANVYHPRLKYPPARAIVSVAPAGLRSMTCIAVDAPDQLFVTKNFIVTHNTITALLLIAYLKQCGKISRPIISVPAGLVSNWASNAQEALPGWKTVTVGMSVARDKNGHVLYKTRRDGSFMLDTSGKRLEKWVVDSPEVKKAKIALLSAGNVDLIIMSRESYTSIPMLRETRDRMIRSDPQYQRNLETQDKYETGRPTRGRHSELVRQLGVYGAMIARTRIAQPGELSFELLGCDFVAVDEGHGLKNLFAPPTTFGEAPRFLGGGGRASVPWTPCIKAALSANAAATPTASLPRG